MFSLRKRRTGSLGVITSADVQISAQNQVKREKGHHDHRPQLELKLPKNFRERMIRHVFTVHNAETENI